MTTITLKSVDFEWPNGHSVFKNLNLSFAGHQKYGLIGPNGVGKSTLAKLIEGELAPSAGKLQRNAQVAYFTQFETPPEASVSEYLKDLWMNLNPSDMDTATALKGEIDFDRSCANLSGGEWTRVRLLKQLASGADFIVLDEPSNNLDREARESILSFLMTTTRGILLISHDRELLSQVDMILELSNQGLSTFGGNWDFYEAERERERTRLQDNLLRAKDEKNAAHREKTEKLGAQEKRMRTAKKNAPRLGMPKIILGARKRQAQKTLGKVQLEVDDEIHQKVDATRAAYENLKIDQTIYAEFPDTSVPASKLIFEAQDLNFQFEGSDHPLWKENLSLVIKGPERVSISGANGSGKTTLLNLLTGFAPPEGKLSGTLKLGEIHYGFIDQQTTLLDETKTVFENADETSTKSGIEIRNLLAQFLFPGKKAEQLVSSLSGGERLRAALAKIMIADPAPQLLILDEPTNNLDLVNLEFLEGALSQFQGALILISHDRIFKEAVGITKEIELPSR